MLFYFRKLYAFLFRFAEKLSNENCCDAKMLRVSFCFGKETKYIICMFANYASKKPKAPHNGANCFFIRAVNNKQLPPLHTLPSRSRGIKKNYDYGVVNMFISRNRNLSDYVINTYIFFSKF